MGRIVEPEACWRTAKVDEAGLLIDAADYYRELYRAALTAKKSLLLTGWQFDSEVPLLRGGEALQASGPVTLLAFLSHLCETRPGLQVCILAWDFNLVFAAEREANHHAEQGTWHSQLDEDDAGDGVVTRPHVPRQRDFPNEHGAEREQRSQREQRGCQPATNRSHSEPRASTNASSASIIVGPAQYSRRDGNSARRICDSSARRAR